MSDAPFPSRNLFCADLIANGARSLAGGLAGRLTFAAASVLCRLLDLYAPRLSLVFCNTKKKVDELVLELRGCRTPHNPEEALRNE